MGKLLLLVLAGLAVAFSVESSRAVLLERMGPLANPGYRWMTNQELGRIVEDLRSTSRAGGSSPSGTGGSSTPG
jgi:hypothetical protein